MLFGLVILLVLVFAGCSSSPKEESSASQSQESSEEPSASSEPIPEVAEFDESCLSVLKEGIKNIEPYYSGTYTNNDIWKVPDYVEKVWVAETNYNENSTRMFLAIYRETIGGETYYTPRLIFNYQSGDVRLQGITILTDIEIKTDNKLYKLDKEEQGGSVGTNFENGGLNYPPRAFTRLIIREEDRKMMEDIISANSVTITCQHPKGTSEVSWTCSQIELSALKKTYNAFIKALNGGEIIIADYFGKR